MRDRTGRRSSGEERSGATRARTSRAWAPDTRTTASAPSPGAVETAAMVSTSTRRALGVGPPLLLARLRVLHLLRPARDDLLAFLRDPPLLRQRRHVRDRVVEVQARRELHEEEAEQERERPHHHLHLWIVLIHRLVAHVLQREHRDREEHGQQVE